MGALWRRLAPLVGAALFVIAAVYLWHDIRAITASELWRATGTLASSDLGLAVDLTHVK